MAFVERRDAEGGPRVELMPIERPDPGAAFGIDVFFEIEAAENVNSITVHLSPH